MAIVTLTGRLGKDIENKTLPSGKAVREVSLAESVFAGGESTTMWFNLSFWGELSSKQTALLKKGAKICVTGKLTAIFAKDDKAYPKLNVVHWELVQPASAEAEAESDADTSVSF